MHGNTFDVAGESSERLALVELQRVGVAPDGGVHADIHLVPLAGQPAYARAGSRQLSHRRQIGEAAATPSLTAGRCGSGSRPRRRR
jgi:hypothetical protein